MWTRSTDKVRWTIFELISPVCGSILEVLESCSVVVYNITSWHKTSSLSLPDLLTRFHQSPTKGFEVLDTGHATQFRSLLFGNFGRQAVGQLTGWGQVGSSTRWTSLWVRFNPALKSLSRRGKTTDIKAFIVPLPTLRLKSEFELLKGSQTCALAGIRISYLVTGQWGVGTVQ